MFANLNRYEQPEFLKKCPEIEITTPKRKFLYKIFLLWNRHLPKARHLNMDTSYPVLHTGDNYLY